MLFTHSIFIITLWDAVILLWKYMTFQSEMQLRCKAFRKEIWDRVAYLMKVQSVLVEKILEMEGKMTAYLFMVNLTLSTWRGNIKNYFVRVFICCRQSWPFKTLFISKDFPWLDKVILEKDKRNPKLRNFELRFARRCHKWASNDYSGKRTNYGLIEQRICHYRILL